MEFNEDSIDLVKTYNNFRTKYPPKSKRARSSVARYSFGSDVIRMADAVIGTYPGADELKGIKTCIAYQIQQIKEPSLIPFFKSSKSKMFSFYDGRIVNLLTDSVILTTIGYRIELNDSPSNLRYIVMNEFIQGFEWVCWWERRGVGVTTARNELVELIDREKMAEYIR